MSKIKNIDHKLLDSTHPVLSYALVFGITFLDKRTLTHNRITDYVLATIRFEKPLFHLVEGKNVFFI